MEGKMASDGGEFFKSHAFWADEFEMPARNLKNCSKNVEFREKYFCYLHKTWRKICSTELLKIEIFIVEQSGTDVCFCVDFTKKKTDWISFRIMENNFLRIPHISKCTKQVLHTQGRDQAKKKELKRSRRHRQHRHLCVFVCLQIKCIHRRLHRREFF